MAPATPAGAVWTTASSGQTTAETGDSSSAAGCSGSPSRWSGIRIAPLRSPSTGINYYLIKTGTLQHIVTRVSFFFVSSNSFFRDRTGIRVEWVNFYSKFLYQSLPNTIFDTDFKCPCSEILRISACSQNGYIINFYNRRCNFLGFQQTCCKQFYFSNGIFLGSNLINSYNVR